ncbi:MAG TPA: ROK family protein, partial [Frankiaceae bacterium]|nr:ROK family protein [Frankiaceae bacterium]
MQHFGIDIGGTGIKGAPVDVGQGTLAAPRFRVETPRPATPEAVVEVAGEVVRHFGWSGPIGATFPAVIKNGVAKTAANVDQGWIGTDVAAVLTAACGGEVTVLNDADAAGIAEMTFGAGRDQPDVVIVATFGTGIGTAVFVNGQLLPNTELGHLEVDGHDAETRASELARDREGLSWGKWAKRVSRYLRELEALLWPDLMILGGGVSKKSEKFLPLVSSTTKIVPAELLNEAGIVGAALNVVKCEQRLSQAAG